MHIIQDYCDENGNILELQPVIACYPTHNIPLLYCKDENKYMLGRDETVVNGKRSDKYCIIAQTYVGVKGATLITNPDEIDYGDVCDEYYTYGKDAKIRSIAWDWDQLRPIIVPHTKHGDWFVSAVSGDKKEVEEFENTFVKSINGIYAFGEHYDISAEDLCKKYPNLLFAGYYNVCTSNADPHDYYQGIVWNLYGVIKVGELFEINDGFRAYDPVFDESGVIIKKLVERNKN